MNNKFLLYIDILGFSDIVSESPAKIDDLYEACYSGIVNEQLAIYDNAKAVAIHLPSPQKSGTFTQQATYNKQAADRVVEEYLAIL